MKQTNVMDMTTGPFLAKIIRFAIPLMCSGLLQQLFNAADTVVLGQFAGKTSLAAVGGTASLVNVFVALALGVSGGANVVVAQTIGAKNKTATHRAVHTAMSLALIIGAFVGLLGFIFAPNALRLLKTPEAVIPKATLYMRIYFCGLPVQMVYNFASGILRAMGDSKRSLLYLTVSGILNVILNLFFVIVLHMDVSGVAIATVTSQAVAAILVTVYLCRQNNDCKLELKKLRVYANQCRQILLIGIPAGLHSMMFSLSNIVLQSAVNGFGVEAIAGNAAAISIGNIGYIPIEGCSQATAAFVGQNAGARRYDQVRKLTGLLLIVTGVVCVISGGLVFLLRVPLLHLYTTEEVAVAFAKARMYTSLLIALNGWMDVFSSSCRGMGQSLVPTVCSLICICGLRLVWIWKIMPHFAAMEILKRFSMLYLCYPISWLLGLSALFVMWLVILKRRAQGIRRSV